MARLPRYALPGQPQHVIQRGNNRTTIFAEPPDFERFEHELVRACARHACCVHAYVLMTNHFHLLVTARDTICVGKAMQSLGRRYVGYFNRRHNRTGTLWEGRFRSVPIDCSRYLLTCYRYIEQNPVRAGMVDHPVEYPWSSFRANALGENDPIVTPHELYLTLGRDASERRRAYRAMFSTPFDASTLDEIRSSIHKGWALGGAAFRDDVTRTTGRRASPRYERPSSRLPRDGV